MNEQALTDHLGQFSRAVYTCHTLNYKFYTKARVLRPHFFLPQILKSSTAFTDGLDYHGAVNRSELKLRRRLLYCPCVLATSSSCRPEFMLWACSVASSACVVGGCCAALNADQLWWCHSLWCHTRWGTDRGERQKGQTKRLHMFSPGVPRTGLVALPHLRVNRFFSPPNLSLLLSGTVISGCYGNSHMPNQPVSGNTRNAHAAVSHTQPLLYVCILQSINTEKKIWIIKKKESKYRDKNVSPNVCPLVDSHGNGSGIFPEITL